MSARTGPTHRPSRGPLYESVRALRVCQDKKFVHCPAYPIADTDMIDDQPDANPDPDRTLASSAATGQAATALAAPTTARASASAYQTLKAGDVINNRFVIEDLIGRGGMGMIFKVRDRRLEETRQSDPYIALKVLADTYRSNDKMILSLQHETQKARSLAHPNIATVYDFDRDGDLVYMTMEMLQGRSLDTFIQQHPAGIPRKRLLNIASGICDGLAFAHANHTVHSDLKPANIFLGADDKPQIFDFGLSRVVPLPTEDGDDNAAVRSFDAGELGGLTPAYATREMFAGEEPHPSDDVYALAIILYEMLTGHHPFQGRNALDAEQMGFTPQPISGLSRREWRALKRGLAFKRERRQKDAAHFKREFAGKRSTSMLAVVTVLFALGWAIDFDTRYFDERFAVLPSIPFAEIPKEDQIMFNAYLQDGAWLVSTADYAGAMRQFLNAYKLHPRNVEAVEAIVALIYRLKNQAVAGADAATIAAYRKILADVMQTDAFLAQHDSLMELEYTFNQLTPTSP